ncbi:hypothetical protein NpNSSI1_00005404 [Neofusicoccum parvum]|uniref:Uncharacterized protein n=1 Tax=Botryosphaeria parva (strain UCR-NP2) TaxID=1287680 RepID=R1H402_BOTPV|nr:hypothetical protein UCRNP2_20 [Neofusicoccum parvum UCRNP2]GME35276.1 hypothetical protein NpNSSI1_00005404 [Neofusicoccum parvum]
MLRVERVQEQGAAMDTLLELAELCETQCTAMLACALCRAQRFPLLCATAVSTRTVQLLRDSWSAWDQHAVAVSIGGGTLDWTDTVPLLLELMSFHLDNMAGMQRSLESVVAGLDHADRASCLEAIRSNLDQLQVLKARLSTACAA